MNKKIRRFVIILGVLAIIFLACVGLGYYYILAPNTSVKDDGIVYLRDSSTISQVLDSLRRRTPCSALLSTTSASMSSMIS